VIGECYDGPFGIDLSKDGPHALIAGTTGAGKSELLQTMIASLACANRPDAMTFVLIDYKGGSAFKDCVHLPHVTGMVTDLNPHLTQRALASLSAELTRREKILAAAGAKDIKEYTERAGREPRRQPLPRLVIVIDEFASLVRDLPVFVTGLVGIAQRGRSLGIHLVLATQRPSGVVSADIRANNDPLVPGRRSLGDPDHAPALAAPLAGLAPRGGRPGPAQRRGRHPGHCHRPGRLAPRRAMTAAWPALADLVASGSSTKAIPAGHVQRGDGRAE
jgi:S-DNA-T family DNA segregation ATPase FtsK/SpoIIIE